MSEQSPEQHADELEGQIKVAEYMVESIGRVLWSLRDGGPHSKVLAKEALEEQRETFRKHAHHWEAILMELLHEREGLERKQKEAQAEAGEEQDVEAEVPVLPVLETKIFAVEPAEGEAGDESARRPLARY